MLGPSRLPALVLRQGIWLVIPPTVLALIGFLVSDAQPRRYETTATLVYQPTRGDQPLDVARTNELVERDVKTDERLLNGSAYQQELDARFGENVTIEADVLDGTDIIEIKVQASSPEAAAGIADAVVEDHLEQRQLEYDRALSTVDVRSAGQAVEPTSPTSPNPVRTATLGAVLGILVGVGLALLPEIGGRRPSSTEDVLEVDDAVQRVGRVAGPRELPSSGPTSLLIAGVGDRFGLLAEHSLAPGGSPPAIRIVGVRGGEGATYMVLNTTVTLAACGRRTALVDAHPVPLTDSGADRGSGQRQSGDGTTWLRTRDVSSPRPTGTGEW